MKVSGGYYSEKGNPIIKEGTRYAFTDKWILVQKPRIPKIQLPKHKKIKKEDQRVDTSFLPIIQNKISIEGVAETKFGTKEMMDHPETAPPGGPSHNQPPNTDTIAYVCQQDFVEGTLIRLSPMRLCQCLADTEVNAHNHQ